MNITPCPPSIIDKEAKKEWKRILSERALETHKQFHLTLALEAFQEYREAQKEIDRDGTKPSSCKRPSMSTRPS